MSIKPRISLAPRLLQTDAPTALASVQVPLQRRMSSKQLLGDDGNLIIEHEGAAYVLRATRLGKLILTK